MSGSLAVARSADASVFEEAPSATKRHDAGAWQRVFMGPVLWPAGARLFQQGDPVEAVYLLVGGTIKLMHIDDEGDEFVVDVKRSPALLGSAFAIARERHAFTGVTSTACSLRWCATKDFLSLNGDPPHAVEIQRLQSLEVVQLSKRVAIMGIRSSQRRLCQFLASYCGGDGDDQRKGSPRRLQLPLKQSEIASFIGITPEHMSRVLRKLVREGRIRRRNGWLLL